MDSYSDISHSLDEQVLINNLKSSPDGLSKDQAQRTLAEVGENKLAEAKKKSIFGIYLNQFKNWLVLILIPAAVISYFSGEVVDCWVIVAVILANSTFGFIQEYRAEKAIASLQKMIVKTAKVLRDGQLTIIPSAQLVPGDVIILEEGDNIAADGRILLSKNLRTKESSLTGESVPVNKHKKTLDAETQLADRINMVWSGTFVIGGYAHILVTGTATNTAIGHISKSLHNIKEGKTSFMKKTDTLAKQMSIIAIISAAIIFVTGYFFRGFEINEILLTSIAALVAAIPEGLPAVITIVLAIGANRMSKRKVIVRDFTATETLGEVTAILTDKTGTLTQNSLTVKKVFIPGLNEFNVSGEGWFPAGNFSQNDSVIQPGSNALLMQLLKIGVISNNSEINHNPVENSYSLVGDPTEGALAVLGKKSGLNPLDFKTLKVDDLPFNSTLKLRGTLLKGEGSNELCVVGAPEILLERASHIHTTDGIQAITSEQKLLIQAKIEEWSSSALRVIALGSKMTSSSTIEENDLDGLVISGIVGMIDPPRPDAFEAVTKCKAAGIRVMMVTGDHVNTAIAIAKATGIVEESNQTEVKALDEQQLLQLDEQEFDHAIRTVSVFARLTPHMKLRIAGRLQSMGHLIAMTGDGVNDAPALKQADVGVSMGIMGTDMARESSDIVLADDNFATIVNAIEEGRIVFANSRNTSFFLVTTNIAESITLLLSLLLSFPIPLTATQLLWLNLVTDGVTDVALATEPGHEGIMDSKSEIKHEKILNRKILPFILINVTVMAALTMTMFFWFLDESIEKARTTAFVVMSLTQLYNVYNLRSIDKSIFKIGFFSNKYITWAVGGSFIILIAIVQIPALASIFRFEPLNFTEFLILTSCSSIVLWVTELYKRSRKK